MVKEYQEQMMLKIKSEIAAPELEPTVFSETVLMLQVIRSGALATTCTTLVSAATSVEADEKQPLMLSSTVSVYKPAELTTGASEFSPETMLPPSVAVQ